MLGEWDLLRFDLRALGVGVRVVPGNLISVATADPTYDQHTIGAYATIITYCRLARLGLLPQGTTALLYTKDFNPKLLLQAVKKSPKLVCMPSL